MRQNDPSQRLDCLRKASAAQLQCLEHTLPKGTAASKDSSKTVPSGAPGHASEIPSSSPIQPGRTESMGVSNGRIPANEFDSPPKADPKTNPRPDVPGQRAAVPAQTNWTFTTSPDPRRTLVTAVIHATPVVNEATFQLSGFDLVRKKVAMACKWAPVQAQTSSGTR